MPCPGNRRRRKALLPEDKPTRTAGPATARGPEAARQPIAPTPHRGQPPTAIVTALAGAPVPPYSG
ncbi:hypothetical protein GCM10023196_095000 [Actinoallomurus vinaceus]|uniref:Uncharacterized protein n=1 Tax=Actinoallomurus vinaceus TaxID=1080074 RepID=A0ABP8USA3_9ACTN